MLNLARPSFIDRDVTTIVAELVARYEELSGKTLYPAQPERLMVDMLAYREIITRIGFNSAAQQNLIQYANGAILDHHALLFGVTRLPARKAVTTLRFTADNEARPAVITISAGTQIRSKDGKVTFVTLADVILELDDVYKDVAAEALVAGASANGYPPGQISELLTTIAFLDNVVNTTLTERGADIESDDQLRQRTITAPESFSVAGSVEAYRFWAFTAHPSIIDVAVENRVPGTVQVYPLTSAVTPSPQVLSDVLEILSDRRVRPVCDTVTVYAPVVKPFTINAQVTLLRSAPAIETRRAIIDTLTEYTDALKNRLGRDIVPNQIIARIQSVPGVYNVAQTEPSDIVRVMQREVATCTSTNIVLNSPVDEEAV